MTARFAPLDAESVTFPTLPALAKVPPYNAPALFTEVFTSTFPVLDNDPAPAIEIRPELLMPLEKDLDSMISEVAVGENVGLDRRRRVTASLDAKRSAATAETGRAGKIPARIRADRDGANSCA